MIDSTKTSSQELQNAMRSAGFSNPTIAVYEELLSAEHLSVQQISELTRLPLEDVQRCVHTLLDLNAVVGDMIRARPVFYALDPDLVWPAFKSRVTWNFIHTLVDTDIESSILQLPEEHGAALNHFRSAIDRIGDSAKQAFEVSSSIVQHRWRDATDSDQLSRFLAESIQHARSSIYAVSKSPRLKHVDLIWQSILSAISRQVRYHRVADLTEIIEHGLAIVTRDIQEQNIDLRVLDTHDIDQKFYVVDQSILVVFHHSNVLGESPNIGRITSHNEIIRRYRKRFKAYYDVAVPGAVVVKELRTAGDRLLDRARKVGFDTDELAWIQKTIDWGRFALDPDPFARRSLPEHPAIVQGLMQRGTTGHLVPNYGITIDRIRRIASESTGS